MPEASSGTISVIVPTFNRLPMLRELLEALHQQEYPSLEILIVDDGSSDGTREAMTTAPDNVRYFRNERNSGPGYSRKRGFGESVGEYVVFADDDDYYTDPGFFRRAVEILQKDTNHELAFVAANARIYYVDTDTWTDSPLPMVGQVSACVYLQGFSREYPKPLSTFPAVFRREALERSGLSESMQVDDRVIYLRALLEGNAFVLPDVIGVYRIHTSNFSATVSADFVMSLQRENRWIYNEICRRHLLADPDSWWYEQSWIAIRFYIQNPASELSGLLRIFRFLRKQRISLRRDAALFKQSLAYWYARRRASAAGK